MNKELTHKSLIKIIWLFNREKEKNTIEPH